MAHNQQMGFVKEVLQHLGEGYLDGKSILEIGSYDVTGSIRNYFKGCQYIGVDLVDGPGVDITYDGRTLSFDRDSFDLAISCEVFEHNPFWIDSFKQMISLVKPGGIIILTCASLGRIEHGTARTNPQASPGTTSVGIDYYKNLTEEDFRRNFDFETIFSDFLFHYHEYSSDLYFVGLLPVSDCLELNLKSDQLKKKIADSLKVIDDHEYKERPKSKSTRILMLIHRPFVWFLLKVSPNKLYQDYYVYRSSAIRRLKSMF